MLTTQKKLQKTAKPPRRMQHQHNNSIGMMPPNQKLMVLGPSSNSKFKSYVSSVGLKKSGKSANRKGVLNPGS